MPALRQSAKPSRFAIAMRFSCKHPAPRSTRPRRRLRPPRSRPSSKQAEDYFHYSIVEHADWRAVDDILALKNITAQNTPPEKFQQIRTGYAQGMGGLPIVGDPDHVASQLIDLSKAGLTGVAVSLVNYLDELPFFCDEVLPRLQRAGLREKR